MPAIEVRVPVRACDVGGWTDTWFAGRGRVCSLALEPGVTVTVRPRATRGVELDLPDLGARFDLHDVPAEHRLVAEAVREGLGAARPDLHLRVTAAVPPGSSLGTSASVCVGVIAALDVVRTGRVRPAAALARAAHDVEVTRLGRQCGVQDQLAAAVGGALAIDVRYPDADAVPVPLAASVRHALDERLVHVAYGGAHDSSEVHQGVVAELGAEGAGSPRLGRLRTLARDAEDALREGDLVAWAATLTAATEAQRALHPALVSVDADALAQSAADTGALGWKVNGAGGAGGSLSVLCADPTARDRFLGRAVDLGARPLALRLATHGAAVLATG